MPRTNTYECCAQQLEQKLCELSKYGSTTRIKQSRCMVINTASNSHATGVVTPRGENLQTNISLMLDFPLHADELVYLALFRHAALTLNSLSVEPTSVAVSTRI